jgi:hypothetical protein
MFAGKEPIALLPIVSHLSVSLIRKAHRTRQMRLK